MKIAADRTGSMAFALQAVLRLSNVAFAAHLESACGWVAARHQKPALAPAAGRCSSLPALLWEGAGVGQGVIRRART
jgi:hypothetical protein